MTQYFAPLLFAVFNVPQCPSYYQDRQRDLRFSTVIDFGLVLSSGSCSLDLFRVLLGQFRVD